jgi:hypothetical protein
VYVFVVGPGSYVEYHGVMLAGGREQITYGATSLPRPSDLMMQLMRIGEDVPAKR